jgi:hypothetical protein
MIYRYNSNYVLWGHEPQGTWLILRLDIVNVSRTTPPSPGCSDYRGTGFVDGTPLTHTYDCGASRDVNSLFDCDASVDCAHHLIPHHLVSTFLACDVEPHPTDLALGIEYHEIGGHWCETVEIPLGDSVSPTLADHWESILGRLSPPTAVPTGQIGRPGFSPTHLLPHPAPPAFRSSLRLSSRPSAWHCVHPDPHRHTSERQHDRLICAALCHEPRRGFERGHIHRRATTGTARPAGTLAVSPQLHLIAEQRHLHIELPSQLESPSISASILFRRSRRLTISSTASL